MSTCESEVFQGKYTDTIVEFQGRTMTPQKVQVSGQAVRVIKGNKVGFNYCNMPCNTTEQVEKALQSARALDTEYQWEIAFPGVQKYPSVEGICDPKIERADITDLTGYCMEIVEGLLDHGLSSKGLIYCRESSFSLQTTAGLDVEEKSTFFVLDIDVSAGTSTFNIVNSSRLWDRDSESLVRCIKEYIDRYTQDAEYRFSHIALGSRALYAVLRPLIWQVSVDRVKRGISRIASSTDVAGEEFTLFDDGLYPEGVRTSFCDGEGIPSRRYPIIKNGILTHILYDHFHALLDGTESTGNAVRTSIMAPPKIGPRNVLVKEGSNSLSQFTGVVVEEVVNDKGANLVSGEYVFNIKRAYYVREGDFVGRVPPFVLKGNVFDLMKSIEGTGIREENPFPSYRELVTPYVFIRKSL
ncbi:MAG: TldD/PmbA family protein [Theionarchaea archaeon]|nr:TldD/PmbA family protein [Theionarchaea archaeon]MBU7036390.1 TldD/PmbA family protein [Theionarchaea archaeon]